MKLYVIICPDLLLHILGYLIKKNILLEVKGKAVYYFDNRDRENICNEYVYIYELHTSNIKY